MTNAENDNSGRVNNGGATTANKQGVVVVGVPLQDKQPSAAVKKAALRDVQNQNVGLARGQPESFNFLGGGPNKDAAVKVCGNKRLTPEPPSGPPFFPILSNTCANELIMNARRRFELELGGGRIQNNAKYMDISRSKQSQVESPQKHIQPRVHTQHTQPTSVPRNTVQPLTKPYGGPSAPTFPVKHGSGTQVAQTDSVKVTIDCPDSIALKGTEDKQRVERITRLEKFLKDCDKTNSRDYFTMLRHLPPSDLSRHAFELERRTIRLTIEEGKEMQRMKVLNVLEKPFSSNDHRHTLHLVQARK